VCYIGETEKAIKAEQEGVNGPLDIKEQKKKNFERLRKALSEHNDMKKLDAKISEMWSCQSSARYLGNTIMIMIMIKTRIFDIAFNTISKSVYKPRIVLG
jgi:hypothetical protein